MCARTGGVKMRYKNPKLAELEKDGLMPEIVIQSLYEDEGLSMDKIGELIGISPLAVHRVLKRFGVETKSKSEAMKISWKNKKQSAEKSV